MELRQFQHWCSLGKSFLPSTEVSYSDCGNCCHSNYLSFQIFQYSGDLMKEEEVLEWLRKNRYRPPEIGIFMYSLIAVTIAFVLYTIFILCFLRPREKKE